MAVLRSVPASACNLWAVTYGQQQFQRLVDRPSESGIGRSFICNTAAAIGPNAMYVGHEHGDALMAVLPSDSHVAHAAEYWISARSYPSRNAATRRTLRSPASPCAPERRAVLRRKASGECCTACGASALPTVPLDCVRPRFRFRGPHATPEALPLRLSPGDSGGLLGMSQFQLASVRTDENEASRQIHVPPRRLRGIVPSGMAEVARAVSPHGPEHRQRPLSLAGTITVARSAKHWWQRSICC